MTNQRAMWRRATGLVAVVALLLSIAYLTRPQPGTPEQSRYLKIDINGNRVADWSGPWACVLDRKTHLLWEVKTDSEDIHDGYWSYSWFDGRVGEPNSGDCYFEKDRCDTRDLVDRVNRQRPCGVGGWRLPSTAELQTLLQQQVRPGQAKIAKAYFPHTQKGDYWTGDGKRELKGHYQHLGRGAAAVSFLDGRVLTLPYRNAAFVRLVTSISKDSPFSEK